jgi:hypothetical protein
MRPVEANEGAISRPSSVVAGLLIRRRGSLEKSKLMLVRVPAFPRLVRDRPKAQK